VLTVNGNLSNFGLLYAGYISDGAFTDTLTVTGTLTNQASVLIGSQYLTGSDIVNAGALVNNGSLSIGSGSTLNLTAEPNGITDVVVGSNLDVAGTFKAGANNGLYQLNSVEGTLTLANGAATSATPGSGTLTVAGTLAVNSGTSAGTSLTVNGNVNNSGTVGTSYDTQGGGFTNTLTVTGALTNQANGTLAVGGYYNDFESPTHQHRNHPGEPVYADSPAERRRLDQ
jgi:hypothetical protein